EELAFFLELMAYVAEHEIPSPHPLADKAGHYLRHLNGKPAALMMRLCGQAVSVPTLAQCETIGCALGHMHVISPAFPYCRLNERGPHWWAVTAERVLPYLSAEDKTLLETELAFQAEHKQLDLPRGVIHADLFRDNALFTGDTLCGIIDFYYACYDVLLYDVAVTINDWCSAPTGFLDEPRLHAFLNGYCRQRELTLVEYQAWPVMLRAAALRFWLSRLQDLHFPRLGEMTHIKNPDEFKNILQARLTVEPL
ncbi:MAG: homoserine kinase, partial [Pseudomonadota bacterium]|nr:homoserine kinase [Pseudomonadota bacterium]